MVFGLEVFDFGLYRDEGYYIVWLVLGFFFDLIIGKMWFICGFGFFDILVKLLFFFWFLFLVCEGEDF